MGKLRNFIKKKSPATYNALEYETEKVLSESKHSESKILHNIGDVSEELSRLKLLLSTLEKKIDRQYSSSQESLKSVDSIVAEMSEIKQKNNDINGLLIQAREEKEVYLARNVERYDAVVDRLDRLEKAIANTEIGKLMKCRNDSDYNKSIIPLNNYLKGSGAAISMHFTSIAEKPDSIVYETADIIRTSALSLIAEEINSEKLDGDVAELGVAKGKFARVINALFPEKTLHLFDTFEGFPENDVEMDKKFNYSNVSPSTYSDCSIDEVLKTMRYPGKCVIHKGYFPETAEGLDKRFCFVNIDCDLYKPIFDGLKYFYPRLVKNGCIFVHDYRSKYYKGVRPALKEFARQYEVSYSVLPDNTGTAVIMK